MTFSKFLIFLTKVTSLISANYILKLIKYSVKWNKSYWLNCIRFDSSFLCLPSFFQLLRPFFFLQFLLRIFSQLHSEWPHKRWQNFLCLIIFQCDIASLSSNLYIEDGFHLTNQLYHRAFYPQSLESIQTLPQKGSYQL